MEIIKAFWSKVVLDQVKIEELEENTDLELYRLSREIGREICLCLTKISVLKRFVRSAD